MKKSWKRFLAVAVVLVLTLCVLSSCSDNTQAKIDEAVKTATDTLTKEKDEALAAAKTASDEALAAAQAASDEALKAAQEAADAAKAELEGQVADLTTKLAEAEESAKAAAEAAAADKDAAVKTATEAAAAEKDEAVKAAQEAADATKAELEGQIAELTTKLAEAEESAKAAGENSSKSLQDALKEAAEKALTEKEEAVAAIKTELEGKVGELKDKLAAAEETAKAAVEKELNELKEKLTAAESSKGELETKVADLEKQIEEAAAAAVEKVEEKVEEKAEETKTEETKTEETKTEETKTEGPAVMDYAAYAAAELDDPVCIETYVQDCQGWWADKITVYAQDADGAIFIYNMACSEEDSKKLVPGTKIRVNGFKTEWAGEVEIAEGATFEFVDGDPFIAEPVDMTDKIGTDDLIAAQNKLVVFKGLTIKDYKDMDGNATGAAFAYKDAVGKTDDLYFTAEKDGKEINLCVEFYLRGQDSDVYKAVEGLQIGDVVDVTAYLYWYNGANPHVIAVTKAE